jgi:hypothetical protein
MYDEQVLGRIAVELKAPSLSVSEAELHRAKDSSTLRVRLVNNGSMPATQLIVYPAIDGTNRILVDRIGHTPDDPSAGSNLEFSVSAEQSKSVSEEPRIALSVITNFAESTRGLSDTQSRRVAGGDVPRVFHSWTLESPVTLTTVTLGIVAIVLLVLLGLLAAALAYGGVIFANPLLKQVSATPNGLLTARLDELPRARTFLRLAFRFHSALTSANVTPARLESAIAFLREDDALQRADRLAERLELVLQGSKHTTAKGTALFDAATSERLLLNLPRLRLAFPRSGVEAEDVLNDLWRNVVSPDRMTVIMPADPQQDSALRKATSTRVDPVAILSRSDLTKVLLSSNPLTAFARALSQQIPLARLSAYHRGGGVSRAGAFFGRERELSNVLNREPANYFLVGGRQVGKSSLLKELKRRIEQRGDMFCAYVALIDEDLRGPLVDALQLDPDASLEDAYEHLIRDTRVQYIFIDESDRFIFREASTGYKNLAQFRRLSEEGRAYFILAGYWDLYRTIVFEYNSPLRNFGEQMRLGTLDAAACRQLATEPMDALNLVYESPDLVARIYHATAGRANLMVTACDQIIKLLSHQERTIFAGLVEKVLHGPELRDQLDGWGNLSRNDLEGMRANRLDRIVVYSTVHSDEFTFADVQRVVADAKLDYNADEIRQSLARLTLAVVIDSEDGARYRYCIPIFLEFMREVNLAEALAMAIAEARSVTVADARFTQ